ncbi:MAG: type IV toxin-antitoxin system AbiEi family antitoxin domain-containing protein [Chloroflexi bacterium]|nr:type IV toxin-antitoxin system AbiEi family antitoxin domain-containing protein [Chloroflexota bacterium]
MQRLTTTTKVISHIAELPEGVPIGAKGLLHLGSRPAIDQALSRLVERGQLMRIGRGLYVRPVETRFGKRPPSVDRVIQALASSKGEVVASHGAAAANALGLTTQVPARAVYLTSGRSRWLRLGEQSVELRHAPRWQLTMATSPTGQAIRALAWVGEARAGEALRTLWPRMQASVRQEIINARPSLPTWLARQISEFVRNG